MSPDQHHEIRQRWALIASDASDVEYLEKAEHLLKLAERVAEELSDETAFRVTPAQVLAVALAEAM